MNDLVVYQNIADQIEQVIEFSQIDFGERNLPEFENKVRKTLFFVFREGILSTLKKSQSANWYHKHLERYFTVIRILHKGRQYINVSIQSQVNILKCVIRNEFYYIDNIDFETLIKSLKEDLRVNFSGFNQYDYNPSKNPFSKLETQSFSNTYNRTEGKAYGSGLIIFGLGGYAFTHILPGLKEHRRIACVDYKAERADEFKLKFGFEFAFYHPFQTENLIKNTRSPIIVIASYHSDHSRIARWAYDLNANSKIFIEKPPCVTLGDLSILSDIYEKGGNIEIGFNRRYIPLNRQIKRIVAGKKLYITFSIKEVRIKENHWYYWKNQGGRITGNISHWIDLANFWVNEEPVSITMQFAEDSKHNFNMSVLYKNGSLVNFTSSDKGNSLRGVQELIEIRYDRETILINDYLRYTQILTNGKKVNKYFLIRDKGHSRMYNHFNKNIANGKFLYNYDDLRRTAIITLEAAQMLESGGRYVNLIK